MENLNSTNEFLTAQEVCELLKISRATLWRLTKNTDFPKGVAIYGNKLKRYAVAELKEWLAKRNTSTLTA